MERLEEDDEPGHHEGCQYNNDSDRHTGNDGWVDQGRGQGGASLDVTLYVVGQLIKDRVEVAC